MARVEEDEAALFTVVVAPPLVGDRGAGLAVLTYGTSSRPWWLSRIAEDVASLMWRIHLLDILLPLAPDLIPETLSSEVSTLFPPLGGTITSRRPGSKEILVNVAVVCPLTVPREPHARGIAFIVGPAIVDHRITGVIGRPHLPRRLAPESRAPTVDPVWPAQQSTPLRETTDSALAGERPRLRIIPEEESDVALSGLPRPEMQVRTLPWVVIPDTC